MILQGNEPALPAHLGIVIGDRGKNNSINFLYQRVAFRNDLHRVPIVLLVVGFDFGRVLLLLGGFLAFL